jgi:hypothetical protein
VGANCGLCKDSKWTVQLKNAGDGDQAKRK